VILTLSLIKKIPRKMKKNEACNNYSNGICFTVCPLNCFGRYTILNNKNFYINELTFTDIKIDYDQGFVTHNIRTSQNN